MPDPNSGVQIDTVIFVGPPSGQTQTSESPQEVTEPPAAPTGLMGRANSDGTVSLSWDEASGDDAITGHEILRRRPPEGETTLGT